MKKIILISLILVSTARGELTLNQINKFADCVKLIENSDKYPYGVKSIKVKNEQEARKITINSIKNNYVRWYRSGRTNDFRVFYSLRWCPPQSDKIGNRNWQRNIFKLFPEKIK